MNEFTTNTNTPFEPTSDVGLGLIPNSMELPVDDSLTLTPQTDYEENELAPSEDDSGDEHLADTVADPRANFISRRLVVKTGLLIGGAALGGALTNTVAAYKAEQTMRQRLPATPTHFSWITDYNPAVHNEVMLYFPGTGDIHSVAEAQTLRQLSGLGNLPIGAIVLSHYHSVEDELIDRTVAALEKHPPEFLSFVGKSWGGPEGLKVTARVAQTLGSTLKRFSMWSAPFDIDDGYQGSLGSTIDNWFPDWNVVNFDGKLAAITWQQLEQYGLLHTLTHLDDIREAVMSGEDWNGLRSDVHMLNNLDSRETIESLVPRVSQPDVTEGSYISTFRPWTDPTVNVVSAWKKYSLSFDKVTVPFRSIPANFEGHAEVVPCAKAMAPWFHAADASATSASPEQLHHQPHDYHRT